MQLTKLINKIRAELGGEGCPYCGSMDVLESYNYGRCKDCKKEYGIDHL